MKNKDLRASVALALYSCVIKDSPLGLEVSSAPSEYGDSPACPIAARNEKYSSVLKFPEEGPVSNRGLRNVN